MASSGLARQVISHSSGVIPVVEAFAPKQCVITMEQVRGIIQQAEILAVQNCECRTRYRRCTHRREVFLVFNRIAEKLNARREARP